MTDSGFLAPVLAGGAAAFLAATCTASLAVAAGFPLPARGRRIGCVDGLRGYLALSVLVYHFVIWVQITKLGGTWSAPDSNFLANLGAGGVALFFMTTGLVFYPRILAGFRATPWGATYAARVARIIPLVVASVLAIMLIIGARTGAHPGVDDVVNAASWVTAWQQVPLMGFRQSGRLDAYVLWSLWYEWLFYVFVLPTCALAMDVLRGRLPSWSVPVALLIASLAARSVVPLWGLTQFLPLFAVGMLAYEAQRSPAFTHFLQSRIMTVLAITCIALGLAVAPDPYGLPGLLLFGTFFAIVACGNSLAGLLRIKGALALGECSFGIYLLHGIALDVLFVDAAAPMSRLTSGGSFVVLPCVAVFVAGLTPVTYMLIERPMIEAGSRIARRLTSRRFPEGSPQVEVAP